MEQPPMAQAPYVPEPYPVTFSVDYPDRKLNRLTTAFRIFTVIPIGIVLASMLSAFGGGNEYLYWAGGAGAGILFLPVLLMILFRRKYPRWWYDWNVEFQRFGARIGIYLALMDDRYPSTDEEQSVHLDFPYPGPQVELNRWLPLVKWLLAIPHYVVLFFLFIGGFFAIVIAWFAILFTGRYPRDLFRFVEGVNRWWYRVIGYTSLLVTDKYPPFRLGP